MATGRHCHSSPPRPPAPSDRSPDPLPDRRGHVNYIQHRRLGNDSVQPAIRQPALRPLIEEKEKENDEDPFLSAVSASVRRPRRRILPFLDDDETPAAPSHQAETQSQVPRPQQPTLGPRRVTLTLKAPNGPQKSAQQAQKRVSHRISTGSESVLTSLQNWRETSIQANSDDGGPSKTKRQRPVDTFKPAPIPKKSATTKAVRASTRNK
jgi:hypothetical protein